MVYDKEGRKLWIVEDTGRHTPVGSWEDVGKRLRRPGLPDWWVIARDIGWLPPDWMPDAKRRGAGKRRLAAPHERPPACGLILGP